MKLEECLIAADIPEGKVKHFYRRAGEELTKGQVKAIKKGRKLLRKEMRAQGLKDKESFELTASSMGLYFDKRKGLLWWQWLWHGKGLWALLGALLLLLLALFAFSAVTQLQGHFTINMSDAMFREGFVLDEHVTFDNPTTHLFAQPAEGVPCISISHLPQDIDQIDGQHNADYFAYTFYCRNEGESTVGYNWRVGMISESLNLSCATWVMIFEDGEMLFYAEPNARTGRAEMLPAPEVYDRGYLGRPMGEYSKDPDAQYQLMKAGTNFDYVRVVPKSFVSDDVVATGTQTKVKPGDVHKYTVVIWLEGDDPDCTNDLIGGHVGMDFYMELVDETADSGKSTFWDDLWTNLKFWEV